MKHRISLVFILFLLLRGTCTVAQSLYEIKFSTDDKMQYTCLLVYYNENNSYMRITYTLKGIYYVVNIPYKGATGKFANTGYNNNSDSTAFFSLTGSNPVFIYPQNSNERYTPDYFVWYFDGPLKSNYPYTTDDVGHKPIRRADSYRSLKPEELTQEYLKQFYYSNESDYLSLLRMSGSNNRTVTNNYGTKLYLIIAANTYITDIGPSCKLDETNLINEFHGISQALNVDMVYYTIIGDDFTKQKVNALLDQLNPGMNDIVCFVYRGHGFRLSNQTSSWPQLDFRNSKYISISDQTAFSLDDIYTKIISKKARLNLILADCCNSPINTSQQIGPSNLTLQFNSNPDISKLKNLFLSSSGTLMATAASPGEYSYTNAESGGFFTSSFLRALDEEVSYLTGSTASWKSLILNTINTAKYKSQSCNNCQPQNGLYYTNIK